ncbi:hypothetical protein AVEN_103105-1 [Araneus ventricosus]|uniref:Uncharacterized protein n=1 Tax=Araneus ventricosus TaxID=182803 RepID=A0A4Y2RJ84_ARAVE|nr:hypothetical protein AVEN_103105-1 [Araneus ventricosus]
MLSDGVILLLYNTHIARKTQRLKNCCKSSSGKSGAPLYSPDKAHNLGSKQLSGTRLSSNSGVKTAAENCLKGQERHFYQSRLTKLVLRSDKCLNRFDDCVEK